MHFAGRADKCDRLEDMFTVEARDLCAAARSDVMPPAVERNESPSISVG